MGSSKAHGDVEKAGYTRAKAVNKGQEKYLDKSGRQAIKNAECSQRSL